MLQVETSQGEGEWKWMQGGGSDALSWRAGSVVVL